MRTPKIIHDHDDQTKTQKAHKKVQRNPQLQRIEGFSFFAARLNLPLYLTVASHDDNRLHWKQSSQAERPSPASCSDLPSLKPVSAAQPPLARE